VPREPVLLSFGTPWCFLTCATPTARELPPHLKRIGLKLFGSELRLDNVVSRMTEPRSVSIYGMTFSLVQSASDDSLQNYVNEFAVEKNKDPYGVQKVVDKLARRDNKSITLIDIGANLGVLSIYMSRKLPRAQLLAFEPVPTTYFYMRYNMYLNNVTIWHCGSLISRPYGDFSIMEIPQSQALNDTKRLIRRTYARGLCAVHGAVSAATGLSEVNISYSETSSQLATLRTSPEREISGSSKTMTMVPATAYELQAILSMQEFAVLDYLKIDCEGCEFSVIPAIDAELVNKSRIAVLGIELHQSLMDPKMVTVAEKPAKSAVEATVRALKKRGCNTELWTQYC
jgi:FkbM family methyltransferase